MYSISRISSKITFYLLQVIQWSNLRGCLFFSFIRSALILQHISTWTDNSIVERNDHIMEINYIVFHAILNIADSISMEIMGKVRFKRLRHCRVCCEVWYSSLWQHSALVVHMKKLYCMWNVAIFRAVVFNIHKWQLCSLVWVCVCVCVLFVQFVENDNVAREQSVFFSMTISLIDIHILSTGTGWPGRCRKLRMQLHGRHDTYCVSTSRW